MQWRLTTLACFPLGLAGCDVASRASVTVADSAGVHITITADADRTFAEVDPQPVLRIGGADVSGPTQFFRIQHVHRDSRGNIWVADAGSAEVRLFRPDGTHWKTRGGQGEGPGEFRRLRLLGEFHGDSTAVWDDQLGRLTVFDEEAELARTVRLPASDEPVPRAFDVFSDGTLLAQAPRVLAAQSLQPGQLLVDTTRLVRVDITHMSSEALGLAPGPTWLWTGHSQVPIPFTINSSFDLDGQSIHLVAGPEFRIRVFEAGRLTEIYGVARNPREVTPDDLATYAEVMEGALPEPQLREYLSVLDHQARPDFQPAYYAVVVADDGKVWARIYSPDLFGPALWDVFDSQRRWLGQVRTPAGFMVSEVRGDNLVGVWRDSLGVENVHIYRIVEP